LAGDLPLTAAGHAMVESLVDQVLRRVAELITSLTPHQRAALTRLLRVLLNDVHQQVGLRRHTPVGFSGE
jgi:hypothetical protein